MEKIHGGTIGCRSFRNVLMSKECNMQDGVESGEVFSYCQNSVLKKQFCYSWKTVLEEV